MAMTLKQRKTDSDKDNRKRKFHHTHDRQTAMAREKTDSNGKAVQCKVMNMGILGL